MLRFAALLSLLLLPSQSRDSVRDYLGVTKPFFSPDTSRVVEVREGVTAYLPCQVYNRNNFSVSWIRIVQQTSVEILTSWSFCNDMVIYLCFVSLADTTKKCPHMLRSDHRELR